MKVKSTAASGARHLPTAGTVVPFTTPLRVYYYVVFSVVHGV